MHILNQVQVNLIYNTNRNLFLWIEIFIYTMDLYNCRQMVVPPAEYEVKCATHVLPVGVGPLAFRYQGNGAAPCQYIDTICLLYTSDAADE